MIYLNLFWTFFKIGAFTFGGGYAMLPLIQAEVINKGWITNTEIINFVAISESTPGPFAINISTYIGMEIGGILGALCATLGVVLPSFIIILIVAKFFQKFKDNKYIKGIMEGLKPAAIGLIGATVIDIAKTTFFNDELVLKNLNATKFYVLFINFSLMLILTFKKLHPIVIICFSAIIGIIYGYTLNLYSI